MDLTPPYHRSDPKSRTKSASRLSKLRYCNDKNEITSPNLSLDIVPSSPIIASPSPADSPRGLPVHELLLHSPSPRRKSKTRLIERFEMAEDGAEPTGSRKKPRSKNPQLGSPSPRIHRRSRRRLEPDDREAGEDVPRQRKKRNSGRAKKDKVGLAAPATPSPKACDSAKECNLDGFMQVVSDLVMWKDVAKSSLWFGFGSMCFLSSCFTRGVNISIFSVLSRLGLMCLGLSFFSNSVRRRDSEARTDRDYKLKDEDILRLGRLILPALNLVISKIRVLFSGEPAMTLKVMPFLLLGAEYGHLLTLRRLCALGFFISFTCPKLYSAYSVQICKTADQVKSRVLDAWRDCSRKKMVTAFGVTAFWHLTSIRTRIFAVFICLVVLRYSRQHQVSEEKAAEVVVEEQEEKEEVGGRKEPAEQLQKALVVVETEPKKE